MTLHCLRNALGRGLPRVPRNVPTARRSAATAAQPVEIDNEDPLPSFGRTRDEYEDYQMALRMAQARRRTGQPTKRVRAPGLPNLVSQQRADGASNPERSSKVAGPSRLPLAGRATLKGKEKDLSSIPAQEIAQKGTQKLRRNPAGVQLLSSSLHQQIFPGEALPKPPTSLVDISKQHLRSHGLSPDRAAVLPEVSFELPALQGNNIREHFKSLGNEVAEPYLTLANDFTQINLPPIPDTWEVGRSGWTKYCTDGRSEAVDDLGDEAMVSFDVEVLWRLSPHPVMATAASPTAWYSWISPTLFEEAPKEIPPKADPWDKRTHASHPHDLPRLFSGNAARLLIGHNVGYDRARIAEEYGLEATTTRFIDTLSLHVATRGITSVQRPAWLQHRKNKAEKTQRESETINFLQEEAERDGNGSLFEALQSITPSSDAEAAALQKRWEDVTAVNSLAEVANLHCGHTIDKSIRDRFGDESITHASQLRGELQDLLSYCARDTFTTHEVYKKVFPLYRQNCPHPASFAGMLKMGSSFLPVNESWAAYLKQAEMKYRELDDGVKDALNTLAEKLRRETPQENDPWTRQLDWTPKAARWPDQHTDSTMGGPQFRESEQATEHKPSKSPRWYQQLATDSGEILSNHTQRYLLPLLLKMRFKGHPVAYLTREYWCFMAPHESICDYVDNHGEPVELDAKDVLLQQLAEKFAFFRIGSPNAARLTKLMGPKLKKMVTANEIDIADDGLLTSLVASAQSDISDRLSLLADETKSAGPIDEWSRQLDWSDAQTPKPGAAAKEAHGTWPKWYHDLTSPVSEEHPLGELDLTVKKTVAPLLLRLQWQGFPLTYSREHKWLYRVPREFVSAEASQESKARGRPVSFFKSEDQPFALDEDHVYFRLPHKDGEGNNVGNPLSKSFVKSIENGELASAAAATGDVVAAQAAYNATNMNVLCSYWISSRERIMDQMVVYEDDSKGMILPQVIPMGTVTRRAVEATWLTASNAKKNRVGSELKAMVRAPPGYSIVGADVDSEELWISSVMGDSQFRMHGATAIGWMTLEGTKSAGTDLHSKTAGILGISRDAAKIFNYSRIYGAGQKHSIQLLMQNDSTLSKEKAMELARDLYKATKGARTFRDKTALPAAIPSMWHGGSESYLFNTLEAIAFSERPITPALGCGITRALRKAYLDESAAYLPSRVNWVVQSSGVDYLHLLIVAMEYLIRTYGISARYMISVHDEVRYLAKEEDRYRTALALQIANAWTRALFCYNLGIDDVPQGVAFFSAVDIDHVLRKEVSMTCETPSHPSPIPPGEALDMFAVLDKTGGSLGSPVTRETPTAFEHKSGADTDADAPDDKAGKDLTSTRHRQYLHAQAQVMGVEAKKWLNAQAAVINPEADLLSSHRPVTSPGRRAGIAS